MTALENKTSTLILTVMAAADLELRTEQLLGSYPEFQRKASGCKGVSYTVRLTYTQLIRFLADKPEEIRLFSLTELRPPG